MSFTARAQIISLSYDLIRRAENALEMALHSRLAAYLNNFYGKLVGMLRKQTCVGRRKGLA